MNPITAFISKNLFKIILLATIVILMLLLMRQCNNNAAAEKRLEVANQNIVALHDSIRIVTTNNGKPEADKFAFLVDRVSALEKLDSGLAAEVRNTKGSVSTVIKGDIKIVHDTVPLIVHSQINDSTLTSKFNFDTTYSRGNYRSIGGFTQYNLRNGKNNGTLTTDKIGMSFVTGIKNLDKGKPTIFLRSNYPNFVVDTLEGADIDPNLFKPKNKQHLLTFGINVGWTPFTYDLIKQKSQVNIGQIGLSFGANFNISRLFDFGVK